MTTNASVAKLENAADLKSAGRKILRVRLPPLVPNYGDYVSYLEKSLELMDEHFDSISDEELLHINHGLDLLND